MKRILAVVLLLALVLSVSTACGKKNEEAQSSAPNSVAPELTPAGVPYEPAPLTGLKYEGSYPQDTRFAAVMVNNISGNGTQNARPQWGLSAADVLVEIKVEGGITRFMGLFSDYKNMPQVGPIRSARDQFFQLILPWQPLYVHIGESVVQTEYKNNYSYGDIDINLDRYGFPRDEKRKATGVAIEHTAYATGELISDIVSKNKIDDKRNYTSTFFQFVPYDQPERVLTGDRENANADAAKVDIVHSQAYRTYFTYDTASSRYMMSQYSMAQGGVHDTIDANNNEQLGFKNVLVLFTEISTYPGHEAKDLQKVDYLYGGVGYYFSNGKAEYVYWRKDGGPDHVLRILDKSGNEVDVELNPGKTYLSFVDLDEASNFCYYPTLDAAAGTEQVIVDKDKVDASAVDE